MKPENISNPNQVLIKNKYYPDGLTKLQINDFWLKQKDIILENKSKNIFYFFSTKLNSYVVKRNSVNLSYTTYDNNVNGHIVGIISEMEERSNFGIIDIDVPGNSDEICSDELFEEAKSAAENVYDYFNKFNKCKIIYTGKNGFHIYVYFDKIYNISKIKEYLTKRINEDLINKYTLESKRTDSKINLDLSPNKKSGGYITIGSINKIGLICTVVKNIKSFKRTDCLIKNK